LDASQQDARETVVLAIDNRAEWHSNLVRLPQADPLSCLQSDPAR
jgi:hypothetical protein